MAYSETLLKKFDRLTKKLSSRNQMDRIEARCDIKTFILERGQTVCDEMFIVLKRRDAKRGDGSTSPPPQAPADKQP